MKKILIAGDSFAADWTKKYKGTGWVNMLEKDFFVINVAEAGVSEYKIYKQIEKIKINDFDNVIISHTSPYRIPVKVHPIHRNDILHKNCDLLYNDLKNYKGKYDLDPIIKFYEQYFHFEFFEHIHELIIKEIIGIVPDAVHISFFENEITNLIDFSNIYKDNQGDINHLNENGNKIIYDKIKKILNNE